jgi:hypothetical protein
MCVDMGFQSFTTVSFLSTTLFSVRDADSQARIHKINRFFTFKQCFRQGRLKKLPPKKEVLNSLMFSVKGWILFLELETL